MHAKSKRQCALYFLTNEPPLRRLRALHPCRASGPTDYTAMVTAKYEDFIGVFGPAIYSPTNCVADSTAPVQSNTHPDSYTVYCASSQCTVNFHTPSATDDFDSFVFSTGPTTVCSPASGSSFDVGTTVVTCLSTDLSGNTADSTFNVILAVSQHCLCVGYARALAFSLLTHNVYARRNVQSRLPGRPILPLHA